MLIDSPSTPAPTADSFIAGISHRPIPARVSGVFKELLPAGVAAAELLGEGDAGMLSRGERQMLGRAVPQRVREFAGGRVCAQRAIAQFGMVDAHVGMLADRRPEWPRSLTGSITHTAGFSAAAVGQRQRFRAIGIDAERIGLGFRDIWSQVFLPAEMDWLEALPVTEQPKVAALMFSAKEAFYKCQYEVTRQWLEFTDVTVEVSGWNLGRGSFAVRPVGRVHLLESGSPATGRFAITKDLVLTAMAISGEIS